MEITLNGPSVCAGRAPLVIVFFPGSSLYEQAALAQHQISPASHNRLQRPKRRRIALVLVPDFPPATAHKSVEGWNYQARMVTKPFEASVGGNHLPDFQSSKPCPSEAAGFRQNKRANLCIRCLAGIPSKTRATAAKIPESTVRQTTKARPTYFAWEQAGVNAPQKPV